MSQDTLYVLLDLAIPGFPRSTKKAWASHIGPSCSVSDERLLAFENPDRRRSKKDMAEIARLLALVVLEEVGCTQPFGATLTSSQIHAAFWHLHPSGQTWRGYDESTLTRVTRLLKGVT